MVRLACVSVPYLELQIVLEEQHSWHNLPVAILDAERSSATVMQVNRIARQKRIKPGMRYSEALSLDGRLKGVAVADSEVSRHHSDILTVLERFSPGIEPAIHRPGVFWLDIGGLDQLFGSFQAWSGQVNEELSSFFYTAVVVGFSRFHTYVVARALGVGTLVFEGPDEETEHAMQVAIANLDLSPKTVSRLSKLDIDTLGAFIELPADGIRQRFGASADKLYRMAKGELSLPFQPRRVQRCFERRVELDDPIFDASRVLFLLKRELSDLLSEVSRYHRGIQALLLQLEFQDSDAHTHVIKPSRSSLDEDRLLELIRLKLENLVVPSGVVAVSLRAEDTERSHEQSYLFEGARRHDLEDARHALARVRAEFGNSCVTALNLRNEHAPEMRFEFCEGQSLVLATPLERKRRTMVRRIRFRPQPLHRFRDAPLKGWSVLGLDAGPIVESHGPFNLSGCWWSEDAFDRDYHIARTRRGDLVWLFFDRQREQWFLHGTVE